MKLLPSKKYTHCLSMRTVPVNQLRFPEHICSTIVPRLDFDSVLRNFENVLFHMQRDYKFRARLAIMWDTIHGYHVFF